MLVRFADGGPFQTYSWGEYRRSLGWQPCRWAAFNEKNDVVALMQATLRRYPLGIGLVWCEGGPVGDLSVCDQSLHKAIGQTTGLKRVYCRIRCDRDRHIEDSLRLTAQGWSIPWSPIFSNYSMALDLNQDDEHLLAACERNWRRNLLLASERKATVREWLNPDPEEVSAVYESMQNLKGIDEQHSREEIAHVIESLGSHLVIYRCDDENGELASVGGCLIIGGRANAWFAATNERGRKLNASYAVFWALIQHCRRIGVTYYDLAGIDPVKNHGVYRFKRGTGARPIEYLGEWDWASRPWLRWFGNWAIGQRSRLKQTNAALKNSNADSKPLGVISAGARAA